MESNSYHQKRINREPEVWNHLCSLLKQTLGQEMDTFCGRKTSWKIWGRTSEAGDELVLS